MLPVISVEDHAHAESMLPRFFPAAHAFLLALAFLVALAGFRTFPDVMQFGFTPEFLRIAETSELEGHFREALASQKGIVIDAIRRAPLYPFALIFSNRVLGSYEALRYVQFAALVLSFYLWGLAARAFLGWATALCFFVLLLGAAAPPFYASVLYPYTFQYLLASLAYLSLIYGLQRRTAGLVALAGLFAGLAMYEQATHLFLPAFVCSGLLIFRHRLRIDWRRPLLFVLIAYVTASPWLLRNASLGSFGMNAKLGYALGWTYGHLKTSSPTAPYARRFDQLVHRHGSDIGTLVFIEEQIGREGSTYAQADRKVVSIVVEKMRENPRHVVRSIQQNLRRFPSGLVKLKATFLYADGHPPFARWFLEFVRGRVSILDWVVFFAFIPGTVLAWRVRPAFALVSASIVTYTMLTTIPLVRFYDNRYRGFAGAIILLLAAHLFVSGVTRLYLRMRRNTRGDLSVNS